MRHFPSNILDSKGGKEKAVVKEKGSMIVTSTTVEKPVMKAVPDPEVTDKALRRKFTAEYKLRILKEAEAFTILGQIGVFLHREGLYSS